MDRKCHKYVASQAESEQADVTSSNHEASQSKHRRRSERASIAMQRERQVTSQEGKGRDFRVATFIHLFVAAPIGPHKA